MTCHVPLSTVLSSGLKGRPKTTPCSVSGGISAASLFSNFHSLVFSIFFRNLHVQYFTNIFRVQFFFWNLHGQSFYKFSPCLVFTGIFAQYFPTFTSSIFRSFDVRRIRALRFFTTKFLTNFFTMVRSLSRTSFDPQSLSFEYYWIFTITSGYTNSVLRFFFEKNRSLVEIF